MIERNSESVCPSLFSLDTAMAKGAFLVGDGDTTQVSKCECLYCSHLSVKLLSRA